MRRFIALSLIVIGIFWIGFSGLCTMAFGIAFLQQDQAMSDILPVFLIGVPSIFAGYLLFSFGRWLRNTSNE